LVGIQIIGPGFIRYADMLCIGVMIDSECF
jgi:hypothetical protein